MRVMGRSNWKHSINGFKEIKDAVDVCIWACENLSVNKILLVGSSAVSISFLSLLLFDICFLSFKYYGIVSELGLFDVDSMAYIYI